MSYPMISEIATLTMGTLPVDADGLGGTFREIVARFDIMAQPQLLIQTIDSLSILVAAVLTATGAVCLARGFRWHRGIVLLLALLAGIGLGHLMSLSMGRSMVISLAIGLLCATLAAPMLKWTIAVLAGGAGAFVGINAWVLLAPEHVAEAWAGAGMGFIGLALASFILSRLVVTFFMTVSGAVLFVGGGLALLLRFDAIREPIIEHIHEVPKILPILIAVAAIIGFVIQRPSLDPSAETDSDHQDN